MNKLADPLRSWFSENEPWVRQVPGVEDEISAIADLIEREHELRMEQAKREVRRTMARDMRWAVTMLEARESRRHVRDGIEEGER